jgi:hypothetical protein
VITRHLPAPYNQTTLAIILVFAYSFLVRLPGAWRLPLFIDEPLYLASVVSSLSFGNLYNETLMNKPLLASLYYLLPSFTSSPYLALWLLTSFVISITAIFVFLIGRKLKFSLFGSFVAACSFVLAASYVPTAVSSAQLEHPANLFIVLIVYSVLRLSSANNRIQRTVYSTILIISILFASLIKQYFVITLLIPLSAGSLLPLILYTILALLAAFMTHFIIFDGSFYSLISFSKEFYPPQPMSALKNLILWWVKSISVPLSIISLAAVAFCWNDRKIIVWLGIRSYIVGCFNRVNVRIFISWLVVAIVSTLLTQGWRQHMLIFAPIYGIAIGFACHRMARFSAVTKLVNLLSALALVLFGAIFAARSASHDNYKSWTYNLVKADDYRTAVTLARLSNARTGFVFPAPVPEFYFDASLKPAGFNPENDHRSSISSSTSLKSRFAKYFALNLPEIAVFIKPLTDKAEYVNPRYVAFVKSVVEEHCVPEATTGRVILYRCLRKQARIGLPSSLRILPISASEPVRLLS